MIALYRIRYTSVGFAVLLLLLLFVAVHGLARELRLAFFVAVVGRGHCLVR